MTDAQWLACFDPRPMLEFLKGKASDRKFRLFSCACYRRIWHKLPEVTKQAVEVAERFVDDKATPIELRNARQLAVSHPGDEWLAVRKASGYSAMMAAGSAASILSLTPATYALEPFASECKYQTLLVREIFGNPLRPTPPLPASVLSWNDGTVRRIAEVIYDERYLPEGTLDNTRFAFLADALEEAGCTNADILNHCRQPGEHVRGCWVIDLLLGKE